MATTHQSLHQVSLLTHEMILEELDGIGNHSEHTRYSQIAIEVIEDFPAPSHLSEEDT